jgi:hypothetical protein
VYAIHFGCPTEYDFEPAATWFIAEASALSHVWGPRMCRSIFWDKMRFFFVGIHGTSRGAMANEMDDKISWPEPRRKLLKKDETTGGGSEA